MVSSKFDAPPYRPGIDGPLTLAAIIDTSEDQAAIWVAYPGPGNFKVLVRPLGRRQAEFIEAATEPSWDLATITKRQTLNHERYLQLFLPWVVVDWSGLTVEVLRRLVLLQITEQLLQYKGEIGCDDEAKLLLTRWSPAFAIWTNRVCLDVERFNAEREAEAAKK